jgi:hydroxymethylbilane synthase
LDHFNTHQCVLAERAFLHAMGGGCQSPVAAYARILGHLIHLRAVSFRSGPACHAEGKATVKEAAQLGEQIAQKLLAVNA